MNIRTVLSALGAGITTFLVVTVLVIELLDFEFSAIVGLPVGLIVGGGVFVLLLSRYDGLGQSLRVAIDALAGFGFGILLLLGVSYVNLADFAFEVTVGVAAVIGVLAGIGSWLADRSVGTE